MCIIFLFLFFWLDEGLASIYSSGVTPYIQQVYLTQAAMCSQGASLELLLGSAASHNLYTGYHYIKYQLPAGPMCPSSHNLPWLSKPLVCLIYFITADQHQHNPQGVHPHPHRLCVTLVLLPCN